MTLKLTGRIVSLCGVGMSAGLLAAWPARACPPESQTQAADPAPPISLCVTAAPAAAEGRIIDLAICLDTSGSMQGLIDAARQKLWDIVNDLALAKPTPHLRVALLTYGNDGHSAENGWVNVDTEFTEDLDLVSQKLFVLTTNGGTELVGRVLDRADTQLQWTASEDALKIIIVAGNESADQDQQMPYREVCKRVIAHGIMVDSIYCGPVADNIAPGWREVATLADGQFAAIDHQNGTVVVSTPFDDELTSLSAALNTTYVPFGAAGKEYAANQIMQDENATGMGKAVAAQRCETKSGVMYQNGRWDLIDACKSPDFKLAEVKDEDLPEAMRAMSQEQRVQYVQDMQRKRGELQAKAADLSVQRQKFVAEEMRKLAGAADKSFDVVIRKAVRQQAESKGFQFEDRTAATPAPAVAPQATPAPTPAAAP